MDPTEELITYSFVMYLQHDCHDVKCKPSNIQIYNILIMMDTDYNSTLKVANKPEK